MESELHKRILLFLYQYRNTGELHDLTKEFTHIDRNLLAEKIHHSSSKGLIYIPSEEIVDQLNSKNPNNGKPDKSRMENAKPIYAKISNEGIEYLKNFWLRIS